MRYVLFRLFLSISVALGLLLGQCARLVVITAV